MTKTPSLQLMVRIVVESPLPGVTMAVQLGKKDLLGPRRVTPREMSFEFPVRVADAQQPPRLLGPPVQGPPAARFIYINSGQCAGQSGTPWQRRAKVPLAGITSALIRQHLASPGSHLEVRMPGTGRDGGPTCASVRLPPGAWRVSAQPA